MPHKPKPAKFFPIITRALAAALIMIPLYSKLLHLPLALALTTHPASNIGELNLLILDKGSREGPQQYLSCTDTLNTACKITGNPEDRGTSYAIKGHLPTSISTIYLLLLLLLIIYIFKKNTILLLVFVILYFNSIPVSLMYIDQTPVVMHEYITNINKIIDNKNNTIIYDLGRNIENELLSIECYPQEPGFDYRLRGDKLILKFSEDLLREACRSAVLGPQFSLHPVQLSVKYNCSLRLPTGRLELYGLYSFIIRPLNIIKNNNIIIIYNNNTLTFHTNITKIFYNREIETSSISIAPWSTYKLDIDYNIEKIVISYSLCGRKVSVVVFDAGG